MLANPPEPLELPGPSGSAVPTSFRSQRATLRLPADTVERVSALARDTGATPYMVLLAAFGALINRYTHTDDFLVATPVLNRGTDETIGYYGNTVAMRLRPQGSHRFRDLVTATRDTALGAFAHQRVNLDRVVRELNPDRRHGAERMTRVSFGFREPDGGGFSPAGVRCERADLRGHVTQLPLGFMVEFDASGAARGGRAPHRGHRRPRSPRRLLGHFAVLLDSALAEPDRPLAQLELFTADDADWLRKVSSGERVRHARNHARPHWSASRRPARPTRPPSSTRAGTTATARSTKRRTALAHWLIGQGIGTEDRVAVLLDKSPELVITALGIVKAGAVYLPVDPTYPEDRLAYILADSDPKVVCASRSPGWTSYSQRRPDRRRPGPSAAAGEHRLPDLHVGLHRPAQGRARCRTARSPSTSSGSATNTESPTNDRLLQVASQSFDVSIGEIFGMLAAAPGW